MTRGENRKLARIRLTLSLPVFEQTTERIIGQLEDINSTGVKIVSKFELKADMIYELIIDLPEEFEESSTIIVIARCVWCDYHYYNDMYYAVIKFENVYAESDRVIGQLAERYGEE